MHPNQQTIEMFYGAFARLDPETMARCYADDAVFADEVFSLQGKRQVTGMWRMLCEATQAKGADVWKLQYRDVQADAGSGRATGMRTTGSARPGGSSTTASTRSSSSTRRARSCGTQTASTSGAGRARLWARPACCWAGHRCCAARCARQAGANLQRFLAGHDYADHGHQGLERRLQEGAGGIAATTLTRRAASFFSRASTAASLLSKRHSCRTARSMNILVVGIAAA